MVLLNVQGLTRKFKDFEAVSGLDFSINKGEAYGLLGPNGAGKTTAIQMITGLFRPTSGSIVINGIDMVRHPKKAQMLIGIVPQEIALYQEMSARENLYFWGRMYGLSGKELGSRVDEALDIVGLADRSRDKVAHFSGGMKRRVNIGAALLHKPELLIMDEPTVGIDPQSRTYILDTVKRLNEEGMTLIYTSHYMEEVEHLCTRIGIMDHGSIIASGSIAELRESIGGQSRLHLSFTGDHAENLNFQSEIPELQASSMMVNDGELTILHSRPHDVLPKLISFMAENGLTVKSVDIEEPNLESVFLHLTGRSLRN